MYLLLRRVVFLDVLHLSLTVSVASCACSSRPFVHTLRSCSRTRCLGSGIRSDTPPLPTMTATPRSRTPRTPRGSPRGRSPRRSLGGDETEQLLRNLAKGMREARVSSDNNFAQVNSRLDAVHSDVTGVKSDVTGVKSDVAGVKCSLEAMTGRVDGLEGRVDRAESDIQALKSGALSTGSGSGDIRPIQEAVVLQNAVTERGSILNKWTATKFNRILHGFELSDAQSGRIEGPSEARNKELETFLLGKGLVGTSLPTSAVIVEPVGREGLSTRLRPFNKRGEEIISRLAESGDTIKTWPGKNGRFMLLTSDRAPLKRERMAFLRNTMGPDWAVRKQVHELSGGLSEVEVMRKARDATAAREPDVRMVDASRGAEREADVRMDDVSREVVAASAEAGSPAPAGSPAAGESPLSVPGVRFSRDPSRERGSPLDRD